MELCPFLTTSKEKVGCFRECCFYEEDSKCIFVIYDEKKDCDSNEIEYEEDIYEENIHEESTNEENTNEENTNEENIRDTSLESYTYLNV